MTKCVGGWWLEGATRLANLASACPLSHKQGIVKPPQSLEASLTTVLVFRNLRHNQTAFFEFVGLFREIYAHALLQLFGNIRRFSFKTFSALIQPFILNLPCNDSSNYHPCPLPPSLTFLFSLQLFVNLPQLLSKSFSSSP